MISMEKLKKKNQSNSSLNLVIVFFVLFFFDKSFRSKYEYREVEKESVAITVKKAYKRTIKLNE